MPTTLDEVLIEELCKMYDGEEQIVKALPKMIEASSDDDLTEAFKQHLEQTKKQVERLDEVFGLIEAKREKVACEPIKALIAETEALIKNIEDTEVLNAALVGAAQKVEHYEIATYGTMRSFAKVLGFDEATDILEEILSEEIETDEKLTQLADDEINENAVASIEEDEETEET